MKISDKCTKCGNAEIIRIPGQVGAYGAGNNIPTGWTNFSSVKVTRFVCAKCGFSEEWIEDLSDIDRLRAKYQTTERD